MSHLFEPLQLRSIRLKNRIVVSPMCEYSAVDGVPNDWHLVHLGSRAVGGCGLVFSEATAVEPDGRISPADTGLYNDEQQGAWNRIAAFIEEHGSVPGIQLAHAGRKASTAAPWLGGGPVSVEGGGWDPIWSASATPFNEGWQVPVALDAAGLDRIRAAWLDATRRSLAAGFKVIEVHGAHGYLLHQFLSPLSNQRQDEYGGSLENRMRFPLEIVSLVREAWPDELPLFLRISATDWVQGGWDLEQSIVFAKECKKLGVDAIDCSSGGTVAGVKFVPRPAAPSLPPGTVEIGPGYQVPFAEAIRREANIPVGAVGLITEPSHAEEIVSSGAADMVLLARELLRDPYWPRRAAKELGAEIQAPPQYARAW
jgi:2,4-dienoyl-CoA reductase-like NADH-dependent reductase (Old Yellow Enzyme family)